MSLGTFVTSTPLTLGVELEMQLVNLYDGDLTPHAPDLLRRFDDHNAGVLAGHKTWDIKPEITRSMIEIGSSIMERHGPLLDELRDMREHVCAGARFLNLGVAGGGTHPFQLWSDQQIFDRERFHVLHELYGYLAKQFTVFGQHVHLGCANGDDALWLLHALSRYVPHFIALSASSPFVQGQDTGFDSARLNSVFAFPLSGRAPFVRSWDEFGEFFDKMASTGVVRSMKDFYWDIRPKPEFGTIELRVCDTPLDVEKAAALAAYLQCIARHLLEDRPFEPSEDDYLVYTYNRFQACRFGLNADMVDPHTKQRIKLRDDVLRTLTTLEPHASALDAEAACRLVRETLFDGNDAQWIRRLYLSGLSLPDIVDRTIRRFAGA